EHEGWRAGRLRPVGQQRRSEGEDRPVVRPQHGRKESRARGRIAKIRPFFIVCCGTGVTGVASFTLRRYPRRHVPRGRVNIIPPEQTQSRPLTADTACERRRTMLKRMHLIAATALCGLTFGLLPLPSAH